EPARLPLLEEPDALLREGERCGARVASSRNRVGRSLLAPPLQGALDERPLLGRERRQPAVELTHVHVASIRRRVPSDRDRACASATNSMLVRPSGPANEPFVQRSSGA